MRKNEFMRLREFDDMDDTSQLNIGDKFLYGGSVKAQKQNKKEGDEITYYIVIGKSNVGIEYAPMFEVLEKEKKGEEEK